MRFVIEEYTKELLEPAVRFIDIPERKAKRIISGLKCIKTRTKVIDMTNKNK